MHFLILIEKNLVLSPRRSDEAIFCRNQGDPQHVLGPKVEFFSSNMARLQYFSVVTWLDFNIFPQIPPNRVRRPLQPQDSLGTLGLSQRPRVPTPLGLFLNLRDPKVWDSPGTLGLSQKPRTVPIVGNVGPSNNDIFRIIDKGFKGTVVNLTL